jgi:RimJ/RimL family protein N-acetyltransferase
MSAPEAPVIETSRLILRPHRRDDFEELAKMWADPIVWRYTVGSASSEQRSWFRLLGFPGSWNILGFGYWAVEERSSGRYVGAIGFAEMRREIQPSIEGIPELGWALAPHTHGKGYATEALKAALEWGDRHFNRARTVCIIHPENAASLRVAAKIGYREYARGTMDGGENVLLERV